ncbi:hypothetical protein BDV93DRAFT_512178 [Ceratobasidium sp. AG-I]|nr:hypothetical protein BDV93DRAFT_512178 [Ceratobasidium sp. AG-I]
MPATSGKTTFLGSINELLKLTSSWSKPNAQEKALAKHRANRINPKVTSPCTSPPRALSHQLERAVGLPFLRAARELAWELPAVKIIKCTIGQLALTSPNGEGKAAAIEPDNNNCVPIESFGQCPTAYSGITIGDLPPNH